VPLLSQPERLSPHDPLQELCSGKSTMDLIKALTKAIDAMDPNKIEGRPEITAANVLLTAQVCLNYLENCEAFQDDPDCVEATKELREALEKSQFKNIRVSIRLFGVPKDTTQKPSEHLVRRSFNISYPFTYGELRVAAFLAVRLTDDATDSPAFVVTREKHILSIALN